MAGIYDFKVDDIHGKPVKLDAYKGKVLLVVNTASKCGFTPQYEGLEKLHEQYTAQGFSVVGVPCNQFGAQEPGTPDEIKTFCSTSYGVTFPLTEKVEVNGDNRHALYDELTPTPDAEDHSGDIRWNFEKFLIGRDGEVIARFSPLVVPEDESLVGAIDKAVSA